MTTTAVLFCLILVITIFLGDVGYEKKASWNLDIEPKKVKRYKQGWTRFTPDAKNK